jgi:hypothetical protein
MFKKALIVALLFTACSLKSPQAPSWHTSLSVPLVDRSYTVQELVKDEERIVFDANGLLGFHMEENIEPTRIGEHFTLGGFSQSFQVGISDLTVPSFTISFDQFPFAGMCPAIAGFNNQNAVVPTSTFQKVSGDQHSDPSFRSVTLLKGVGRFTVASRLPVAAQNIVIQLQDGATGAILFTVPTISRLNAGETKEVQAVIDGKQIPENNRWLISGTIAGSAGAAVPIRSNQTIDITTQIDQVQVARLEAKVPALSIGVSKDIDMLPGMTVTIDEMAIKKGMVTVTLDNKTPLGSADVSLEFGDITDMRTALPLTYNMSLKPFSKTVSKLDLSGFVARLDLPHSGASQLLSVLVSGTTDDLSDHFISLDEKSLITAQVQFSDLTVDRLSGKLAEQQVVLDTVSKTIDLPERLNDLDMVRFGQARLVMDIYNTIQLPIRFEGKLTAINEKGEQVQFNINQQITPGNGVGEVHTQLTPFTSQNSDVAKLINIRPNRFVASGRAWIGDGVTFGHIKASDYLRAGVVLDVPAIASWTSKEIKLDTTEIRIRPKIDGGDVFESGDVDYISGEATDRLASAKVKAKIENHLPVGGSVYLYLANSLASIADKPDVTLGPIPLPAAATNSAGQVQEARNFEVTLEITEKDMQIFKNNGSDTQPVFISTALKLDGTSGQNKQLFRTDYVTIQALLTMDVLVSKE